MGLLDDLKNQADSKRAEQQAEAERRAQAEQFYRDKLQPRMVRAYQYIKEFIEHLQVLEHETVVEYPLLPLGKPVSFRQQGYNVVIDSSKMLTQIDFSMECVLNAPVDFELHGKELVLNHADRIEQYSVKHVRKDRKSQNLELVSAKFIINGPLPLKIQIRADIPAGDIKLIVRNFVDPGFSNFVLSVEQFNDEFLDRLGRFVLRQEKSLFNNIEIPDEDRQKLRQRLEVEKRQREQELIEAEARRKAEEEAEKANTTAEQLKRAVNQTVEEQKTRLKSMFSKLKKTAGFENEAPAAEGADKAQKLRNVLQQGQSPGTVQPASSRPSAAPSAQQGMTPARDTPSAMRQPATRQSVPPSLKSPPSPRAPVAGRPAPASRPASQQATQSKPPVAPATNRAAGSPAKTPAAPTAGRPSLATTPVAHTPEATKTQSPASPPASKPTAASVAKASKPAGPPKVFQASKSNPFLTPEDYEPVVTEPKDESADAAVDSAVDADAQHLRSPEAPAATAPKTGAAPDAGLSLAPREDTPKSSAQAPAKAPAQATAPAAPKTGTAPDAGLSLAPREDTPKSSAQAPAKAPAQATAPAAPKTGAAPDAGLSLVPQEDTPKSSAQAPAKAPAQATGPKTEAPPVGDLNLTLEDDSQGKPAEATVAMDNAIDSVVPGSARDKVKPVQSERPGPGSNSASANNTNNEPPMDTVSENASVRPVTAEHSEPIAKIAPPDAAVPVDDQPASDDADADIVVTVTTQDDVIPQAVNLQQVDISLPAMPQPELHDAKVPQAKPDSVADDLETALERDLEKLMQQESAKPSPSAAKVADLSSDILDIDLMALSPEADDQTHEKDSHSVDSSPKPDQN